MFKNLKKKIEKSVAQTPLRNVIPPTSNSESSIVTSPDISSSLATSPPSHYSTPLRDSEEIPDEISPADTAVGQLIDIPLSDSSTYTSPIHRPANQDGDAAGDGRYRHPSNEDSFFNDSSIFPPFASSDSFYVPSDIESVASEFELTTEGYTKDDLFQMLQRQQRKSLKYRGKFKELVSAYKNLASERDKLQTTLSQSQDRAFQRISELKEQVQLDQKAKTDVEQNYQLMLDEKAESIKVLRMQINLLKEGKDPNTDVTEDDKPGQDKPLEDVSAKHIEDLQLKVAKLESMLSRCKEIIKSNRENLSIINQEKEDLLKSLSAKEEELTKASTKIETIDTENSHMRSQIEKARKVIEDLESDKAITIATVKQQMHGSLEEKDRELESVRMCLQEKDSESSSLRADRDRLVANVEQLERSLHEIKKAGTEEIEKSKTIIRNMEIEKQTAVDEAYRKMAIAEDHMEEERRTLNENITQSKVAALAVIQEEANKKVKELHEAHTRELESYEERERNNLAARDAHWESRLASLEAEHQQTLIHKDKEREHALILQTSGDRQHLHGDELDGMATLEVKYAKKLKCLEEKLEQQLCEHNQKESEMHRDFNMQIKSLSDNSEKESFLKNEEMTKQTVAFLKEKDALEERLQLLTSQLEKEAVVCETSNKRIFELENENKTLSEKVALLSSECDDKENTIKSEKEKLISIGTEAKRRIKELKESMTQMMKDHENELSKKNKKFLDEMSSKDTEINTLTLRFESEKNAEIQKFKKQIEKHRNAEEAWKNKADERQIQMQDVIGKLKEENDMKLKSKDYELEEVISDMNESKRNEILVLNKQLSDLEKNYNDKERQWKQMLYDSECSLNQIKSDFNRDSELAKENLQKSLSHNEELLHEKNNLEAKLTELQVRLINDVNKTDEIESANVTQTKEIEQLSEQLMKVKTELDLMKEIVNEKDSAIENMILEHKNNDRSIQELHSSALQELSERHEALVEQLTSSYELSINELKSQHTEHLDKLTLGKEEQLGEMSHNHEKKVEDLLSKIQSSELELINSASNHKNEVKYLQSRLEDSESLVATLKDDQAKIAADCDNLYIEHNKVVSGIREELSTISTELTEKNTQIGEYQQMIHEVKTFLSALHAMLPVPHMDYQNIQEQMSCYLNSITDLCNEVNVKANLCQEMALKLDDLQLQENVVEKEKDDMLTKFQLKIDDVVKENLRIKEEFQSREESWNESIAQAENCQKVMEQNFITQIERLNEEHKLKLNEERLTFDDLTAKLLHSEEVESDLRVKLSRVTEDCEKYLEDLKARESSYNELILKLDELKTKQNESLSNASVAEELLVSERNHLLNENEHLRSKEISSQSQIETLKREYEERILLLNHENIEVLENKKLVQDQFENIQKEIKKICNLHAEEVKCLKLQLDEEKAMMLEERNILQEKVISLESQVKLTNESLQNSSNTSQTLLDGMKMDHAKKLSDVEEMWKNKLKDLKLKYVSKLKEVVAQHNDLSSTAEKEHNGVVSQLETEILTLKESLNRGIIDKDQCILSLQNKQEQEITDRDKQISELRIKNTDLSKENTKLISELETSNQNWLQIDEQRKSTDICIDGLQKSNSELSHELNMKNEKIEILTSELTHINNIRQEKTILDNRYLEMEKSLQERDSLIETLNSNLEFSAHEQNKLNQDIDRIVLENKSRVVQLEEDIVKINNDHSQAILALKDSLISESDDKIADYKKKAETYLSQMKKQFICDKESIIADYQTRIADLETDAANSKSMAEDKATECDRITKSHKDDVENMKREYETSLQSRKYEADELNTVLASLSEQIEKEKSHIDLLQDENVSLKHQMEQKDYRVQEMELRLRNVQDENTSLIDDMHKTKQSSRDDFVDVNLKLDEAQRKCVEYENQLSQMESKHADDMKKLLKEFDMTLASKEEELHRKIETETEKVQSNSDRFSEEHQSQMKELHRAIHTQDEYIEELKETHQSAMKSKDEELSKRVDEYENVLSALKEKLQLLEERHQSELTLLDACRSVNEAGNDQEISLSDLRRQNEYLLRQHEFDKAELKKLVESKHGTRALSAAPGSRDIHDVYEKEAADEIQNLELHNLDLTNHISQLNMEIRECSFREMMLQDRIQKLEQDRNPATISTNDTSPSDLHQYHLSNSHLSGPLITEPVEMEYLRNILFEYMTGRETKTLAKVISTVMRFTDDQVAKIMRREEQHIPAWLYNS